ncbi:hypothetical protein EYR40_002018 [Pleurotus pulmonarius]|nr:hypothetical protein EYR40_002018 [Pleurotus pulmonarius]
MRARIRSIEARPESFSAIFADTLKMARRGAPANAVPSFAPQIQPRRAAHDPDESAFSRFLREQIWAPEKLSGNISIVTGVGMFIGGIVAVRTWGDLMIPA